MENLSKALLHYGKILYDVNTVEQNGFRRVRAIKYNGMIYMHHMLNGEVIDIQELI